jgi:Family of unknown function (DUF6527)
VRATSLVPQFVEFIPESLENGVLYISQRYSTASHKCCCGCGEKVVTPLRPTDWSLTIIDGSVTLHPSIGNWSYPCRSHYFIRRNRVVWAGAMSQQEINQGRAHDRAARKAYFDRVNGASAPPVSQAPGRQEPVAPQPATTGMWRTFWRWLRSWLG